jgi:Tol biopolymer transport system component
MPGDATSGILPVWAPDESGLDYVVTRAGVSNIWRQPLTGGPPVQVTHFTAGKIFSFAWSRDGKWLSLGSGMNRSDAVVIVSEK